jgi:hypothetical protein
MHACWFALFFVQVSARWRKPAFRFCAGFATTAWQRPWAGLLAEEKRLFDWGENSSEAGSLLGSGFSTV